MGFFETVSSAVVISEDAFVSVRLFSTVSELGSALAQDVIKDSNKIAARSAFLFIKVSVSFK